MDCFAARKTNDLAVLNCNGDVFEQQSIRDWIIFLLVWYPSVLVKNYTEKTTIGDNACDGVDDVVYIVNFMMTRNGL
jgi:hypothetical protein